MNPTTDDQINAAIKLATEDFPDDHYSAKLHSDTAAYMFLAKAVMLRLPPDSVLTEADCIHRMFLRFTSERVTDMLAASASTPLNRVSAFMDIVEEAVNVGAQLATSVHQNKPLEGVPLMPPARPSMSVSVVQ
jgi:hypothetical protein